MSHSKTPPILAETDLGRIIRKLNLHDELVEMLTHIAASLGCPICGMIVPVDGHAPDCRLAALLAKAKENTND